MSVFIPLSFPNHQAITAQKVFYLQKSGQIVYDGLGVCPANHRDCHYHEGFVYSIGKSPNSDKIHFETLLISAWDDKGKPQAFFTQDISPLFPNKNYLRVKSLCAQERVRGKNAPYRCEFLFDTVIRLKLDKGQMTVWSVGKGEILLVLSPLKPTAAPEFDKLSQWAD